MKFVVQADWKHASRREIRRNKLIGFLICRKQQSQRGIIEKIFSSIHRLASHSNESNRKKWKHAEKRMLARFRKRI